MSRSFHSGSFLLHVGLYGVCGEKVSKGHDRKGYDPACNSKEKMWTSSSKYYQIPSDAFAPRPSVSQLAMGRGPILLTQHKFNGSRASTHKIINITRHEVFSQISRLSY